MVRLYEFPLSGNCYKVRLLLAHLGTRYERVSVDLKGGETRRPEFLARFPLGRVPAAELEDGAILAESNALLCYFAEGTPYLPKDRLKRAKVMQWLFWEQYGHEPYIAVLRAWKKFFGIPKGREAEIPVLEAKGKVALATMDKWLKTREFLEEDYSIADISLYAYTHMADQGGFALTEYDAIGKWMERVRQQKGHIPLIA